VGGAGRAMTVAGAMTPPRARVVARAMTALPPAIMASRAAVPKRRSRTPVQGRNKEKIPLIALEVCLNLDAESCGIIYRSLTMNSELFKIEFCISKANRKKSPQKQFKSPNKCDLSVTTLIKLIF